MTTTRTAQHVTLKPLLLSGAGLVALALLTGCGNNGGDAGSPAAEETTTSMPATAQTSPGAGQTSPGTDDGTTTVTATATPTGTAATASPTTSDTAATNSPTTSETAATSDTDAVFAAIGAVLSEHSEGVITAIDREGDREEYEIDLVAGNEVIKTDVLADGTVREDGRDSDDEEAIRDAQQADVTAEDAIRTALEGREGQVLDEAELDEDDGSLHWQIELDRTEGGDGDRVSVDAMTGEVTQR